MAALSGLLLYAAFPPLDLGPLGWVALVPLLLAVREAAPVRAFRLGYLAGFVAFFGILAWIRVFGFLPWVLLAAYLAIYVGSFAAFYRWLVQGRSAAFGIWLVPIVWTALEYLRSVGVLGFPWALLGTTQHAVLPTIQIARVTGVFGISFVLALASASVATIVSARRPVLTLVPLVVVAAVTGWGVQEARLSPAGTLTVAALQPSVRDKLNSAYETQNMRILQGLVEEAGRSGAELIVFPETALPKNIFGPSGSLNEVGTWARQVRATLIASSLENGISNIAVAVAPSGMALSRYDKVRLVAFGENGIRPGTRHDPLWTPVGRVGVAICFESIFPEVSRTLVRNGAEVLAVITNDAWFDGTAGPAQHAAQAPFRAVETGRWVVRAANTGISSVIDPVGRVRAAVPPGQEAVVMGRVAMANSFTLYDRWGDAFAQAAVVLALLLAVPRLRAPLAREWRQPVFQQTAAVVTLPLISSVILIRAGVSPLLWSGLLLAFVAVFSFICPPAAWGVRREGSVKALVAGLAVVLGLWSLLIATLRAYNVASTLHPVTSGGTSAAMQILVAVAVEAWLRGITFAALLEWKGWPAAVSVTTVLGIMLQAGLPAEAVAWTLLTGAAFGLIRAWTGNAAGLVIPHAVGNVLFAIVAMVR